MMDELILERLLARTARATAYPPTPQLSARVRSAIANPPRGHASGARSLATALGALCIAAAALLAFALPSSRGAIADFFRIEGSRIERLPAPSDGVTPTPFPTPVDITSIATPTTLDAAAERLPFTPALPPGRSPSAVYFVPFIGPDPFVLLHFDGFDVWEGQLDDGFVQKWFGGSTVLSDLTVKGRPARWLSGGSHIVQFIDRDGHAIAASQRTVDRNTLVWRTPFAFYRIETDLSLAEAVAIAETLP